VIFEAGRSPPRGARTALTRGARTAGLRKEYHRFPGVIRKPTMGERYTAVATLRLWPRILLGVLCSGGALTAGAADTPVSPEQAQFGGQCAEGLAQGQHVRTSCNITWADKDGKTYCFSSPTAKSEFLKNPADNLQKARDFFAASSTESTEKAMQAFDSSDAEAVVKEFIDAQSKANNGAFPYQDPLNGQQLKLAFDGIDFTRTIDGYGFFPDVKFHDQANEQKRYLIDFWVAPANGVLKIQEVRIYKEPVQADGAWTLTARSPIPWWWIPASEHPGHMATKRGWEVMSAVERGALAEQAKNNGVFKLKDDKTGKVLDLEFVDTHQPIRQLDENGHYFACTDFRAAGTPDQIYDVDFWVNDKDGTMTIEQTRVHKVPELKDGKWIQVPRYEWKELGSSHVVP
jgi:YHS domain-containing protein